MQYILLGIGTGLWMYAFVTKRWNNHPWMGPSPFFWMGLASIAAGLLLFIKS